MSREISEHFRRTHWIPHVHVMQLLLCKVYIVWLDYIRVTFVFSSCCHSHCQHETNSFHSYKHPCDCDQKVWMNILLLCIFCHDNCSWKESNKCINGTFREKGNSYDMSLRLKTKKKLQKLPCHGKGMLFFLACYGTLSFRQLLAK